MRAWGTLALKGVRRALTKGPWDTLKWGVYHLHENYREWSLGIETADFHDGAMSLGQDCYEYQPMCYACIETALAALNIDAHNDVLLDYGSGKGRILVAAATRPFRRVIGVEMHPDLNAVAEENLRRAQRKLTCKDVEIVTADAASYPVPTDVSVVFFFNSFGGRVLSAVQDRLEESLREAPRKLRLISLLSPEESESFAACDWLVPQRELPTGMWRELRFTMYESRTAPRPSLRGPTYGPHSRAAGSRS